MAEEQTDKMAADRLRYRWREMIVEAMRSEIFAGDLAWTYNQLAKSIFV
jgi:hypothetical protein